MDYQPWEYQNYSKSKENKGNEILFPWAYSLDKKEIVHIDDVDNGEKCNCICPSCKKTMIARNGMKNVREHHFAHKGERCDYDPTKAYETYLHQEAKKILKQARSINYPRFILKGEEDNSCNKSDKKQLGSYIACDSGAFSYGSVKVEQWLSDFKPDIILCSKTEELLVEVAVTNLVNDEKREKIRKYGSSCIEINISALYDEYKKTNSYNKNLLLSKLENCILKEVSNKKWIWNKHYEEYLQNLKKRNTQFQKEWEGQQKELEKSEEELKDRKTVKNSKNPPSEKQKEENRKKLIKASNKEIEEILQQLNDEQIGPVLQTEGAVLVLAGAGSGKTRVLTSRIAYLIDEMGVPASGILAITFTNKAANEMKERIARITDISGAWVCTIHSMCVRILRMFANEVGINDNFSIYSETERNNIIKKSFQECDYDDEKLLKSIKFHIGNAKMLGLDPDQYAQEYAGDNDIEEVTKVYKRYQKHLRENNSLDFDDLLNETRLLLKGNEEAREYLSSRFRYILVDEFQDTNAVQYEIIKMLASHHGNLFVVGDDDQSIYGWRGAKIENILHFEKDFKNTKVFKLERNYRSTKKILDLANTVIKNNGRRKDKTLWTENPDGEEVKVYEADEESGEARYIARTITGFVSRGYSYSDFAVLMRLNALTRSLEQEFLSDGIPFKVFGGFKFYERKEIKDMLAYLRLINNPFDSEALVRIINFPKRGIGAKTVENLQNYAFENELSVYDALFEMDEIGFTGATKLKLENFRNLVKEWIILSQDMTVNELTKRIIEDTEMRSVYADDSDESINKRANIDEFVNSVDEYCRLNPTATLTDYLNQITLLSDTDEMDDGNYVTLATIHAVKGLEFAGVFICGLEENILPVSRAVGNDDDMEEERRLMYVAVTRAKKRLFLTRSKSRYLYGSRNATARSRFLKELSEKIDMPEERPTRNFGYSDWNDPESYGNSAYGGGRYASNNRYSGSSYGSSTATRTPWTGNNYDNSYGKTYGGSYSSSYQTKKTENKEGGFTYGGISRAPVKKPTTGGKDISAFKVGVKVKHPKFGIGTIINVNGAGANTVLNIAFEGLGIKQLSAGLAPLTIV